MEKKSPVNIRLEYEYSNLRLNPLLSTNINSATIGIHLMIRKNKFDSDLNG